MRLTLGKGMVNIYSFAKNAGMNVDQIERLYHWHYTISIFRISLFSCKRLPQYLDYFRFYRHQCIPSYKTIKIDRLRD